MVLESRKKDTEVGRELEIPADVGFAARAVGAQPQEEVVSSHWFLPFFSSSLSRSSWVCFGVSWLCLIWRCCLLCVVCVSWCCRPAPVPCKETVLVLCHPVCSLLPPPAADLPVGCRCIALSGTWPEAESRGETPMSAPDLPWTTPATGSVQWSLP